MSHRTHVYNASVSIYESIPFSASVLIYVFGRCFLTVCLSNCKTTKCVASEAGRDFLICHTTQPRNSGPMLQDLAAATGKPRFTRRSFSLRQHGRAGFAGAIRSRQASLELSTSPARSALLPEQHTPPVLPPVSRKSNWEVIEHFSSSSGSLTRSGKPAQSANLIAVSPPFLQQVELFPRRFLALQFVEYL